MTLSDQRIGGYLPIGGYSLIGDCRSAALVGVDGSIDWCCLPRFDSPSVFGRILDAQRGGYWQLRPHGHHRSEQRYGDRSNVLRTIFHTPTGLVLVSDFMPVDEATLAHQARPHGGARLVRIVDCLSGSVTMEQHIEVRPDYGRAEVAFEAEGRRFHGDAQGLHLCVVSTRKIAGASSSFSLSAGDAVALCLRCQHSRDACPTSETGWTVERARRLLRDTLGFWWRWIARVRYDGAYPEPVWRSALALKLMTYAPTGAIVAAPTASLPEALGGQRNWDYRFTWLRDASLTLFGLFQLGLHDEAHDFFEWLRRTGIGEAHSVQNLYRVDGEARVGEETLGHWSGYRDSAPVRIGNAAADQLQLDVYGELLDSAYLYARFGGEISHVLWTELHAVVDLAIERWESPDASIWESRGRQLHYTYSKMMCWVAVDRGLRLAERFGLPHDRERWDAARRAIHRRVTMEGYSRARRSFTQTLGGRSLDAAMLRASQVRLLEDRDPRIVSTVRAIERHLGKGVLVTRYRPEEVDDGVDHGTEGAFLMCSFWLVDALAHVGKVEEAQRRFERLLAFSAPVGLMAEEVDPGTGEQLGNYPQAFTHLALIGAAVNIERARHRRLAVEGLPVAARIRDAGSAAATRARSRARPR
ncbi:MAG TPA: glycoside hydrolase family 15 protein [Candidatus Binatia bacterium]|nr:glycoside hydrolase family 15 protein [Candidatus Binatia bacterium]